MAKNNNLMLAMKVYRKQLDAMIPVIYASMVLGMHTEIDGITEEDIRKVLAKSQELWEISSELNDDGSYICGKCKEVTGIDVRYGGEK